MLSDAQKIMYTSIPYQEDSMSSPEQYDPTRWKVKGEFRYLRQGALDLHSFNPIFILKEGGMPNRRHHK